MCVLVRCFDIAYVQLIIFYKNTSTRVKAYSVDKNLKCMKGRKTRTIPQILYIFSSNIC